MSTNSSIRCEYIYLLREREFVNTDEPVFKIGRTTNLRNRMNQYPKDTQIILIIPVDDSVWYETNLIKIFEERFERAKVGTENIGKEYFVGNLDEMVYIIETFIKYHYPGRFVKSNDPAPMDSEYDDSDFAEYEVEEDDM